MPLGTKSTIIITGDLVKVCKRNECAPIPLGTIAAVRAVIVGEGPKYVVEGHEQVYLDEDEIELVSYVRNEGNR